MATFHAGEQLHQMQSGGEPGRVCLTARYPAKVPMFETISAIILDLAILQMWPYQNHQLQSG